jgi:DNA-directed RNA polymerase subunit M/transcription elongation factor TFIIS
MTTAAAMEGARCEVARTLASFIPDFSELQIQDLERTIFNSIIAIYEAERMDSVWGAPFESLYRRAAVEVVASLTTEAGYGNGNETLLSRILCGHVRIEDLATMKPYEIRPEIFADVTSGARELEKAIDTFTGVTSTMFTCQKCRGNHCTYSELQTRSSDEGTTTFVTCLSCAHKWSFEG